MFRPLFSRGIIPALLLLALSSQEPGQGGSTMVRTSPVASFAFSSTLPVLAEHRYRMAAKIRPFLLFWMGRDNVGGARIVWRRGQDGTRGWDLLIGSDPNRAPAHVNRWGYIREEGTDADLSMLGVMKQSNEQSLEEARSHVENAQAAHVFKLIRTRVVQGESDAVVMTAGSPTDFTYHDLPALLSLFQSSSAKAGAPRHVHLGRDSKPGFLVAVADLVHDTTYAFHKSGKSGLTRRTATYAYNGALYALTLEPPHVLTNATYGNRTYGTLLQADFSVQNRTGGSKEQFTVVFGTSGAIEEVPVYIAYQPRWWFKAELVLDENQTF